MESALTLTKVAECLYWNGHGTYFALIKVRGKQIKRSFKTEGSALARRRLAELWTKAHGLSGEGQGMTFDHLAERWLALKKGDLRPGSWKRLVGILRVVKPFFDGLPVRSVGQTQIEAWKIKRGALVGPRSFNYEREILRRLFEYVRASLRIILKNRDQDIKKRKVGKAQLVIPTKEQFRVLVETLRVELIPIFKTGEAVSRYVSKYVEKNLFARRPEDKGKKLVRYMGWKGTQNAAK